MRVRGDAAYPTWFRRPLPLDAPRARFAGFAPSTQILRKGQVRRVGAMPLPCDIVFERDVAVTLRDGTVIYTDIFRPAGEGQHPAIVSWSPYGKEIGGQWLDDMPERFGVSLDSTSELMKWEGADPAFWVAQGYAVLQPDIRGAYRSGGNLVFWGSQTAEDGYDFIEWAALQPWSSGRIGLAGNSWLTVSQWFIAAERPPHLAAIAPWEGASDIMRDDFLRGGIPRTAFPEALMQTFAGENLMEDITRMVATEQDETPYWADKIARLEQIAVPAYIVASYDNVAHTHGTFEGWRRIASKDKWLRVHNTQEWPDFYDPQHSAELLQFFDRYLKGVANGWEDTPRVRISVLDPGHADEIDRVVGNFPPEGYDHRSYYLGAAGTLAAQPGDRATVISYDVAEGTAAFLLPIDHDAELVGYSKLKLWVEADGADDIDLAITMEKVDAQGEPIIRESYPGGAGPTRATGYLRASRRALDPQRSTPAEPYLLMQGEQRLAPGEIVPLEIAIWPIALRFHAGEQLKLTVAPFRNDPIVMPFGSARIDLPVGCYTFDPAHPPEMQTLGGDASTSPDWVADQAVMPPSRNRGTHRIHLGGRWDSHLLVPLKRL